jgi:hypothetical protein
MTNSRGVAVADFWIRGVMDIEVSASSDRHASLHKELMRNWLQVELVGVQSNRDAVGARIIAVAKRKGRRARSCWATGMHRRVPSGNTLAWERRRWWTN